MEFRHDRVVQGGGKFLVLQHLGEIAKAEVEGCAGGCLQAAVAFQQGHAHGVENGPHGEYQQQDDRRRQVKPCFPLMLAVYHITSPLRE